MKNVFVSGLFALSTITASMASAKVSHQAFLALDGKQIACSDLSDIGTPGYRLQTIASQTSGDDVILTLRLESFECAAGAKGVSLAPASLPTEKKETVLSRGASVEVSKTMSNYELIVYDEDRAFAPLAIAIDTLAAKQTLQITLPGAAAKLQGKVYLNALLRYEEKITADEQVINESTKTGGSYNIQLSTKAFAQNTESQD